MKYFYNQYPYERKGRKVQVTIEDNDGHTATIVALEGTPFDGISQLRYEEGTPIKTSTLMEIPLRLILRIPENQYTAYFRKQSVDIVAANAHEAFQSAVAHFKATGDDVERIAVFLHRLDREVPLWEKGNA